MLPGSWDRLIDVSVISTGACHVLCIWLCVCVCARTRAFACVHAHVCYCVDSSRLCIARHCACWLIASAPMMVPVSPWQLPTCTNMCRLSFACPIGITKASSARRWRRRWVVFFLGCCCCVCLCWVRWRVYSWFTSVLHLISCGIKLLDPFCSCAVNSVGLEGSLCAELICMFDLVCRDDH